MPSKNPKPDCNVRGCPRLRAGFSSYCTEHKYKLMAHGHPTAERTSERLFKRYRKKITDGLLKYAHHNAMLAACEMANHFLDFRPQSGFTYEREIERWAQRARESGVSAMDVLRAVAEFHALLNDDPRRFKDGRAERHALARRVLLLGPTWGTWRPRARVLNNFGQMLKEALGTWAWAFLKRLDRDDEERRELRRKAADFDSVPPKAKRDKGGDRDAF